jgi:FkbH-like protein
MDYGAALSIRTAHVGNRTLTSIAEAAIADTKATLHILGDVFEIPIFVHNSANIRRHDHSVAERAKNLLTARARRYTRNIVNKWLDPYLEELNSTTFRHFFVLDEAALLEEFSDSYLGSLFYDSDLQHPAQFGKALAPLYETAILTHCTLATKKVIACDLDNTLWNGVIGEGAVTHYADRQKILKDLRHKGLLLAINSKNDPKNVHWTGSVLSPDDFAATQINWQPKVQNLQRIAQDLNLKTKDFLFIDDRADERAMVTEIMPEIHTLDADSPQVWRQLELLAHILPEQSETDRTVAYKQRDQRQKFLDQEEQGEVRQHDLFAKLGLTVSIHPAERKELKRVTELINRTNQFNMCGSRTTLKQITSWFESSAHSIIVVEADDKFGSMGVVSVIVLELGESSVDIPVFVLSCRVFGYGVETCILNFVKRLAGHSNSSAGKPIVGHLTFTPHNEPCRRAYPENGFTSEGDDWLYTGGSPVQDPEWLTVSATLPSHSWAN